MKKVLPYLAGEIVISLMISLFMSSGSSDSFLTTFGTVNLGLGILGLILGALLTLFKDGNVAKGLSISSALLLLMGFLTCSMFN
ncbi:MAG TPA: hypothetical protein VGQ53_18380 [Chitinophagaceae bacterium]|jgi:hypothetical protein|nr:hypothetical protein [Chitinophagaceae bacterium]